MVWGWNSRTPKGSIIIGGQEVAQTLMCVHCGHHWIPVHGSGATRGFCRNCMGPTCGHQVCDTCFPYEKQIEAFEQGKLRVLR